ncbi:helix-turn-helix domain-containing protein [Flammeovirga aprica]|uniref:Helix-turn-helix domain-containing protein n=1 Tax=Flammeovirga aprica JL-4 TaxID=694437 RepID=A0A7X9S147_9BACT|nr:helix-turn-helix domain-containing protein [Flammeovirga aprica]NME72232.1 helix-turn-helix domain-containing protein [Flammeovirga aprica JL-4]
MNLTIQDREYIEFTFNILKFSRRKIAKKLCVAHSTVCRELKRNSIGGEKYKAHYAHHLALARKKLIGGRNKKKSIFKKYKRKRPYRLYANRCQICWASDMPDVYSFYRKHKSYRKRLKIKRYQKRLHLKKIFHFRNDLFLFMLLKLHIILQKVSKVETSTAFHSKRPQNQCIQQSA